MACACPLRTVRFQIKFSFFWADATLEIIDWGSNTFMHTVNRPKLAGQACSSMNSEAAIVILIW